MAGYTNGQNANVGTIVLADFANLQGLQPVGNNAWKETGASGQPILGQPGNNGLSKVVGQATEASNVDMSKELVNMIIAQRTYQANSQTIKTQNEIMQVLMNISRAHLAAPAALPSRGADGGPAEPDPRGLDCGAAVAGGEYLCV